MSGKKGEDDDDKPGDSGTGMEKQDMKKMLSRAGREPVNCALAQSDGQSGGQGLILMDKIKPPKAIMKMLKEQFPTARTPCFGTASIDMKQDPKAVTFKMNKKIPGLDRKVRKTLKTVGVTSVVIESGADSE